MRWNRNCLNVRAAAHRGPGKCRRSGEIRSLRNPKALTHPKALAVRDPQDLSTIATEVDVSPSECSGQLTEPHRANLRGAMRAERIHILALRGFYHPRSSYLIRDMSAATIRRPALPSPTFGQGADVLTTGSIPCRPVQPHRRAAARHARGQVIEYFAARVLAAGNRGAALGTPIHRAPAWREFQCTRWNMSCRFSTQCVAPFASMYASSSSAMRTG